MSASDISNLSDGEVLAAIAELEATVSRAHAEQLRLLARFAELRPGRDREFAAEEVALEVKWTVNVASHRLDLAETLTTRLPATLEALERAEIDLNRARVLAELTHPLSDADARQVEHKVLPRAREQNASQLRQSTRRAVARVDPEGLEERHRRSRADRRMGTDPRADGMADLSIFGPADEIAAAYGYVDAIARAARAGGDTRTLEQIRADTALDLLSGRWIPFTAESAGGGTQLQVIVPAGTLLGLDGEPAELAGHGPIPASMARDLAADATWRRLLTEVKSCSHPTPHPLHTLSPSK